MRVLITGGAGFIGGNLVRRMVEDPAISSIAVLDDLSSGNLANLSDSPKLTFTQGSILDGQLVADLCREVSSVVHLAAIPSVPRSIQAPTRSNEANVTGTLNVLEAARSSEAHVIVASSSSVYGATVGMPKSVEMRTRPMSPYAVSKQATESYAIAYSYSYGMDSLAFRFFNVYGPLQAAGHAYAAVVPAFIDAALAGRPLPINGDGLQSRDFTYVETVADVITSAVKNRISSRDPVNLALGTNTTLLEVASILEEVLGRTLEREHGPNRAGDVRASQADAGPLRALFPSVPVVGLRAGLAATVEWFRASISE